jgi:pimeloyl-ACP methyl ester carboxylesterase
MVACPALADDGALARVSSHDGLELAVESHGPAPAGILYAHGFGQTRHAWTQTARALAARGLSGLAVDARGHGESGWLPGGAYRLDQFVGDAHALAAHAAPRPVWVGASMGGLVGLIAHAESATPLFSALVLVDITPRWEAQGVDRILSFLGAHPEGFASLADAQRAIDQYLPHRAARGRSPERLAKLLVRHHDGRYRWHWDPALLATVAPEAPTWTARLTQAATKLDLPVLLISGGRSDVVSDATIAEFRALVPHAEHRRLDDATHMVVGDENDRFTATIADYLHRTGRLAG